MANYDVFSKHFDQLMGNPIDKTKRIENYIHKNFPNAKSILDIGCGTGSILHNISDKYEKIGIDLSKEMIAIAKQKVKSAKFYQKDINTFKFAQKFDVILCVFDTINHLLQFKQWDNLFNRVKSHLNHKGLLIFDVNTQYSLKRLSILNPQIQFFGKNSQHLCCISVKEINRNLFNWSVKIFEHQKGNNYQLFCENIPESCFSIFLIKSALHKRFKKIFVESDEGKKSSEFSERIWFICKN